jgi:flagellar basal body P-ring formation protein FlgA
VHREVRLSRGTLVANAVTLDPRLTLAPCAEPLSVRSAPLRVGMTRATVAVSCAGPSAWTINVIVELAVEQPVLIAQLPIARGAALSERELMVATRRVPGMSTRYLGALPEVRNHIARRPIAAGEILSFDALAPAIIVKRGQIVTVLSESGGVAIRATGRAMADSALQGRLRVQNASSLKVIEGIVESADTVRVGR